LNIVDESRECPTAIHDTSVLGRRLARELTAAIKRRGNPGMVVSDSLFVWLSDRSTFAEDHDGRLRSIRQRGGTRSWREAWWRRVAAVGTFIQKIESYKMSQKKLNRWR
jgi:hypothetical protein